MTRSFICLIILSVAFISCSKENGDKELPVSLRETISKNTDCTCLPTLDKYSWKGQVVYVKGFRGPACNWIPTFYNEQGEVFSLPEGYSFTQFHADSKFLQNVWHCE